MPARPHRALPIARRLAVVALTLITAALLAACGPEDSDSDSAAPESASTGPGSLAEPELAPSIVSEEQIAEQREGSPEAGLLEWWSAFQFRDVPAVLDLTTDGTVEEIGQDDLIALVEALGSSLAGIRVQSSETDGDVAVVRALLLGYQTDKAGDVVEGSVTGTPRSFTLVRDSGTWRFDEPSYLAELLRNTELPEQG